MPNPRFLQTAGRWMNRDLPEERAPVDTRITELRELGDVSIEHLINNGEPVYDGNLPTALRNAYAHSGKNGVVASMPYLIAGKAQTDKDNYLWKNWFTALSEEDIGIDKKGNPVIVTVHGGGILTPDRIQQAYDEGLTEQRAAKLTEDEFNGLLNGVLPSGENIEFYIHADVVNGAVSNPFGRYAVAMDFETAKATKSGYLKKDEFMSNPLVHARVGTLEHLESYFEKAKNSNGEVRNSHLLNDIDYNRQQGRLLFLGGDHNGLDGFGYLGCDGRFVGVAPEARSARK